MGSGPAGTSRAHFSIGLTIVGATLLMSGIIIALVGVVMRLKSPHEWPGTVGVGLSIAIVGLACGAMLPVVIIAVRSDGAGASGGADRLLAGEPGRRGRRWAFRGRRWAFRERRWVFRGRRWVFRDRAAWAAKSAEEWLSPLRPGQAPYVAHDDAQPRHARTPERLDASPAAGLAGARAASVDPARGAGTVGAWAAGRDDSPDAGLYGPPGAGLYGPPDAAPDVGYTDAGWRPGLDYAWSPASARESEPVQPVPELGPGQGLAASPGPASLQDAPGATVQDVPGAGEEDTPALQAVRPAAAAPALDPVPPQEPPPALGPLPERTPGSVWQPAASGEASSVWDPASGWSASASS